jgi:hypothetical protein
MLPNPKVVSNMERSRTGNVLGSRSYTSVIGKTPRIMDEDDVPDMEMVEKTPRKSLRI